jgi:pimeloyl-ACP methyl ester carboxylesterase
LGEREHLANPSNDLETHIQDMLGVIKYEDLNDIVLVGHSYGGMVPPESLIALATGSRN